jgi:hypothetical protein
MILPPGRPTPITSFPPLATRQNCASPQPFVIGSARTRPVLAWMAIRWSTLLRAVCPSVMRRSAGRARPLGSAADTSQPARASAALTTRATTLIRIHPSVRAGRDLGSHGWSVTAARASGVSACAGPFSGVAARGRGEPGSQGARAFSVLYVSPALRRRLDRLGEGVYALTLPVWRAASSPSPSSESATAGAPACPLRRVERVDPNLEGPPPAPLQVSLRGSSSQYSGK